MTTVALSFTIKLTFPSVCFLQAATTAYAAINTCWCSACCPVCMLQQLLPRTSVPTDAQPAAPAALPAVQGEFKDQLKQYAASGYAAFNTC
eukprot:1141330-Pelagomonas_calceolata.AAC.2